MRFQIVNVHEEGRDQIARVAAVPVTATRARAFDGGLRKLDRLHHLAINHRQQNHRIPIAVGEFKGQRCQSAISCTECGASTMVW